MKIEALKKAAATLALGLAAWCTMSTVNAQPMFDRVHVNLPYTVTIGERTLQPGDYIIQQLPSTTGDSRVLLIYSNNGMNFETSAMSIPALDPNTARSTKVILHHYGSDYYVDKIWIQGKDYGYEFPLPDRVKSREKERSEAVSVAANYSTAQTTDTSTTTTTASETTPPVTDTTTTTPPPTVDTSVNTTPPPDTTMSQQTPPVTDNSSADRSVDNSQTDSSSANRTDTSRDNTSMPSTSAGWLLMLLSGGTLSGAGLSLGRKR